MKPSKEIRDKNFKLVYDRRYRLWKGSEYLGVATWTEDSDAGDAFLKDPETFDGGAKHYTPVWDADRWEPEELSN
jgi:hypothetical protein